MTTKRTTARRQPSDHKGGDRRYFLCRRLDGGHVCLLAVLILFLTAGRTADTILSGIATIDYLSLNQHQSINDAPVSTGESSSSALSQWLSSSQKTTNRTNNGDNQNDLDMYDCQRLLLDIRNGVGSVKDPNFGRMFARFTVTNPPFFVSLHNFEFDPVRYGTLEWGKYYEKKLTIAFEEVLVDYHKERQRRQQELLASEQNDGSTQAVSGSTDPPHVIDVGGNIGWFSLVAMASGATVDTFEPNPVNVLRMCESVCLNGWEECPTFGTAPIHQNEPRQHQNRSSMSTSSQLPHHPFSPPTYRVLRMGLMDEPGSFKMIFTGLSPGQGEVVREGSQKAGRSPRTNTSTEAIPVNVRTLDEMAHKLRWYDKREIAILKIDVEGNEYNVLMGGKELIQSKRVQNIFTEGKVDRGTGNLNKFRRLAKFLMETGYMPHKIGGSMGPNRALEDFPPPSNLQAYIDKLVWACGGYERKNRQHCNLWWKLTAGLPLKA